MAKKKAQIEPEQPQQEPQDQPIDYKELHESSFKELGQDEPAAEPVEPPAPVGEPAPVEPVTPPAPPLDAEKLKAEVTESVTKAVAEQIKAIKQDPTITKEAQDKAIEELKPIWLREGRTPKSYEEIAEESTRIAEIKIQQRLDAQDRERQEAYQKQVEDQQKAQEAQKAKDEAYTKQLESEVQDELAELYQAGKLPKIVTADDPNDPGIIAQRALFETAVKINTDRLAKNLPPIRSINRIYNIYYKPPTAQPAGADAPVGGGKTPTTPPEDKEGFIYVRDHYRSIKQLARDEAEKAGK